MTQAIEENIMKQTFKAFTTHIIDTMLNYPAKEIDHITESMDKRMRLIVQNKSERFR